MGIYVEERRVRSDNHLPEIKSIIAKHFMVDPTILREATFDEDTRLATDLFLYEKQIGVRVREPHQIKYKGEVIFRHQPDPVGKTEWEKILSGLGRWYFYTFALDAQRIGPWWLLDLNALRTYAKNDFSCCVAPWLVEKDREDAFMTLSLNGFPEYPPLVVATNEKEPQRFTDTLCDSCRRKSLNRWWEENYEEDGEEAGRRSSLLT